MANYCNNILETIGNTPIVKINRLAPPGIDLFVKVEAHTRTTALEILDVFRARQLDYFVTGYGTGGTLKGTARALRQRSPHTRIVVCEPDNSPLLGSGSILQFFVAGEHIGGATDTFQACKTGQATPLAARAGC